MERDFPWLISPLPFSHSCTNTGPQFYKGTHCMRFGGVNCPTHSSGPMIYAWSFLISLATGIGSEADMPKPGHLQIIQDIFAKANERQQSVSLGW